MNISVIPGLQKKKLDILRAKVSKGKIYLFARSNFNGKADFKIYFVLGDNRIEAGKITWPDDFDLTAADDPESWNYALGFRAGVMPFERVEIVPLDAEITVALGEGYSLQRLFARSEKEFGTIFFRARNRVRHRDSLMFSCWQILNFGKFSAKINIVAAVIYAYKLMEAGRAAPIADIIPTLKAQVAQVRDLPRGGGVRTDARLLTLSGLTVIWHCELYLGRFDDAVATLNDIVRYTEEMKPRPVSIIYNVARAIAFLAMIEYQRGDQARALELCALNFKVFKETAHRIEAKSEVFFDEMLRSGPAIAFCLSMINKSKEGKFTFDLKQVFPGICRVNPDQAAAYRHLLNRTVKLLRHVKGN